MVSFLPPLLPLPPSMDKPPPYGCGLLYVPVHVSGEAARRISDSGFFTLFTST